MKRKPHTTSLVLLLVIIFAFWWGISVLSQFAEPAVTPAQVPAQTTASNAQDNSIVLRHTSTNGVNTYTGTVAMQSSCDSLGSGIRYSGTNSEEHVAIILTTAKSPVACAQADSGSSAQSFAATITLHAGTPAPVFDGVILDGANVPAQLVEAN